MSNLELLISIGYVIGVLFILGILIWSLSNLKWSSLILQLKNLWNKIKPYWKKIVVGFLCFILCCFFMLALLHPEIVSGWFKQSLEDRVSKIKKEYQVLNVSEQDITGIQSKICVLQSEITELEQKISNNNTIVGGIRYLVLNKKLRDKIEIEGKSYEARELVLQAKIANAHIDFLNRDLDSFNQEKIVLDKQLKNWMDSYTLASEKYIHSVQLNSSFNTLKITSQDRELSAEAIMKKVASVKNAEKIKKDKEIKSGLAEFTPLN